MSMDIFGEQHRLEAEIERLRAENEQLLEQILQRTPSVMEKDMQEIMRINNQLLADKAELLALLKATETPLMVGGFHTTLQQVRAAITKAESKR